MPLRGEPHWLTLASDGREVERAMGIENIAGGRLLPDNQMVELEAGCCV
jgi:hypothetical protein